MMASPRTMRPIRTNEVCSIIPGMARQQSDYWPERKSTVNYLGGAPLAEIIPVRIATSVILLYTSAFAEAVDYLIAPNGNVQDRVDVISMSMGGTASRAWAEVVNRAYEAGITIVSAAGNNKFRSPERIVFPARFNRVIAACGIMADRDPLHPR